MKQPGLIIYRGKSFFSNHPIAVIATGFKKSKNVKTGNMIHLHIIRTSKSPYEANRDFDDQATCGTCKHAKLGTCYVNLMKEMQSIYNAYHRDAYIPFDQESHKHLFAGRGLRIGSFGDPCAVPFKVWEKLINMSDFWTGYTHAWNNKKIDSRFKSIIMASCDTPQEYAKAQKLGWRTFRILDSIETPIDEKEFRCPASKEMNHAVQCHDCGLCSGTKSAASKSPCIVIHGCDWKIARFQKWYKKHKNKEACSVQIDKYRKITAATRKLAIQGQL